MHPTSKQSLQTEVLAVTLFGNLSLQKFVYNNGNTSGTKKQEVGTTITQICKKFCHSHINPIEKSHRKIM